MEFREERAPLAHFGCNERSDGGQGRLDLITERLDLRVCQNEDTDEGYDSSDSQGGPRRDRRERRRHRGYGGDEVQQWGDEVGDRDGDTHEGDSDGREVWRPFLKRGERLECFGRDAQEGFTDRRGGLNKVNERLPERAQEIHDDWHGTLDIGDECLESGALPECLTPARECRRHGFEPSNERKRHRHERLHHSSKAGDEIADAAPQALKDRLDRTPNRRDERLPERTGQGGKRLPLEILQRIRRALHDRREGGEDRLDAAQALRRHLEHLRLELLRKCLPCLLEILDFLHERRLCGREGIHERLHLLKGGFLLLIRDGGVVLILQRIQLFERVTDA